MTVRRRGDSFQWMKSIGGVRHNGTFKAGSMAEAHALYQSKVAMLEREHAGQINTKITVADAIDLYLKFAKTSLKPASLRRYGTSLSHIKAFFAADKRLSDIKHSDILSYVDGRREHGGRYIDRKASSTKRSRIMSRLSTATIRRDLAAFSCVFTRMTDTNKATANPVKAFLRSDGKSIPECRAKERSLSVDEEAKLLEAIDALRQAAKGDRDVKSYELLRSAAVLSVEVGFRQQELFKLNWSDVHMGDGDEKYVHIRATNTKSGRPREIGLTDRAVAELHMLKAGQGPQSMPSWPVFRNDRTRERYRNFQKPFERAVVGSGLEHFSWHDLRRTCGGRLLDAGVALSMVSEILGHSTIEITRKHYARHSKARIIASARALDAATAINASRQTVLMPAAVKIAHASP